MTDSELQQLILACRKHESASQKKLYRHFYNYGMTICSRYAQNREEASEILNDGFVKIFTKLDKYSDHLSFKAWLSTIMVNTAIDAYRKRLSKPMTVDLVHAQHLQTSATAIGDLSAKELLKMVQSLPPSYRMAFSLHAIEGFTHVEIGQKLGISVGTSKSNLAKARVKLQALIHSVTEKKSKYG